MVTCCNRLQLIHQAYTLLLAVLTRQFVSLISLPETVSLSSMDTQVT